VLESLDPVTRFLFLNRLNGAGRGIRAIEVGGSQILTSWATRAAPADGN
jgi:hypothetical protein